MNLLQLYKDYNVPFKMEGHKHTRHGWINVECPFCTGNPGWHLGATLDGNHFYCWRCGWKPAAQVLARLLNMKELLVKDLIRKYGGISAVNKKEAKPTIVKKLKLPSNLTELAEGHKQYLYDRGFDWPELVKVWQIKGTNIISLLNGLNYSRRIFIPFFWDQNMVSFDTRDITDGTFNKYQACPLELEVIPHKEILYGKQEAWSNRIGICVEGPTDVWRFRVHSFATSGIKVTKQQIRVVAKNFDRVAVIFDDDPQAVVEADKLVAELIFRKVDAFRVPIIGDPGAMKQEDADYLVKSIL